MVGDVLGAATAGIGGEASFCDNDPSGYARRRSTPENNTGGYPQSPSVRTVSLVRQR
ncbi:hypothetical protein AB0D32_18525 [Micromonospora sp. NPDC048170]|uniref:hypothetical protein n=1 Tax=Micromonospora sp. NPDC048170 TaxID=3154819 RepID=UPI0033FE1340